MILLRRFATEAAREEARMFCDELVAEEAIALSARADRGVALDNVASAKRSVPTIFIAQSKRCWRAGRK